MSDINLIAAIAKLNDQRKYSANNTHKDELKFLVPDNKINKDTK